MRIKELSILSMVLERKIKIGTEPKKSEERQFLLDKLAGDDIEKRQILMRYWQDLDEGVNKRERDEAKELIESLINAGIQPIITVPEEFAKKVEKEGISARETWIPGLKVIAGTLGVPFFRIENRVPFEIECRPNEIMPRFTGQDQKFHGVVAFRKDFIGPDKIQRLEI